MTNWSFNSFFLITSINEAHVEVEQCRYSFFNPINLIHLSVILVLVFIFMDTPAHTFVDPISQYHVSKNMKIGNTKCFRFKVQDNIRICNTPVC